MNKTIDNLFVTYKIAKELKEKGFDIPCFGYYYNDGRLFHPLRFNISSSEQYELYAPTYQQVEDWLRENHNIEIQIDNYHNKTDNWSYRLLNIVLSEDYNLDYESNHDNIYFPTYYQAKEKAIEHILKNYIK